MTQKNINNFERDKDESEQQDSGKNNKPDHTENTKKTKSREDNLMRNVEIEKIVLHCGGIDDKHEKSVKLLEKITGRKVYIVKSKRRFPEFGISPGKKSGCKVTVRDKEEIKSFLKRFFAAVENKISRSSVSENQYCFGIKEYIEVPGLEYDRDVGILGFEVMVIFTRKGKRVKLRKIKQGKYPRKQEVTREEVINYLSKNFNLEVEK